MAGHTPGPWVALIHNTYQEAVEDSGFSWIDHEDQAARFLPLGTVYVDTGRGVTGLPGSIETTAANARLIAAAPDLLEALTEAAAVLYRLIPRLGPEGPNSLAEQEEYEKIGGAWSVADRALSKARGEA